jgi:hypothetical protein
MDNCLPASVAQKSAGRALVDRVPGQGLALFLVFFLTVVGLQWLAGAYQSEFGGSSQDEGAHYITGLMVRDYIANLFPAPPMQYAEDYYLHYPHVALGHWPPFFYLVQAAWTVLFSPSRPSVLLLMAIFPALLALTLYKATQGEFGPRAGMALGLLLILLPLVQEESSRVMAEHLLALLSFWAMLSFSQYLETEKGQYAVAFGVLAALAILTKGNAMALALVPPIALVLSRRCRLLKQPSFWYPAVIVLILCGPWYFLTLPMVQDAFTEPSWALTKRAFAFCFQVLVGSIGPTLSLLVLIGFVVRLCPPFRAQRVPGRWAAAGALVVSVWIFHALVPLDGRKDTRYMITALPPLLMFLASGMMWLAARLPLSGLSVHRRAVGLALLVTVSFATETFQLHRKAFTGFAGVAQCLLSQPELQNAVFLISSDTSGEQMFISEVAMREPRPGHIILRGSKVLASSTWTSAQYRLLYRTPEEVRNYLQSIPVGVLVISTLARQSAHEQQLIETVNRFPEHWEPICPYQERRHPEFPASPIHVYRAVGQAPKPVGKIRIDMRYKLGRAIEN